MSEPSASVTEWYEHPLVRLFLFLAVTLTALFVIVLLFQNMDGDRRSNEELRDERVTSYTSRVTLDSTGGASVRETFTYNFKDHLSTGIVRLIPSSLSIGGYFPVDRNIGVSTVMRNYNTEPITVQQSRGQLSIKTGDKTSPVSGEQTYEIPYQLQRLVLRTETADIIRFSPTEIPFGVPVDATSIIVDSPVAPLRADCYVGTSVNDRSAPCRSDIRGTSAFFSHTRWLEANEGLFIELDYPKGTFSAPTILIPAPRIPVWAILIVAHIIVLTGVWLLFGRDHRGRGVVVPSEELLEDIKPYEAGALLSQGPSYASFLGMILDLAERGVVKINRYDGGGYLVMDVERIQGAHHFDTIEDDVLKRLFRFPFAKQSGTEEMETASIDQHSEETRLAYRLYEKLVYKRLTQRGWYSAHILTVQLLSAALLITWTISLNFFLEGRVNDAHLAYTQWQIPFLLPLVYFMPRLTKKGALARERVNGLAWYIKVAEKDRLAFHESPQRLKVKPGKLLPYAVAMNLQKDWKKQFLQGFGKADGREE